MSRNALRIRIVLTPAKAGFFFLIALMAAWPRPLGGDTLTLTTYFPAPAGKYSKLSVGGRTQLSKSSGTVVIGAGAADDASYKLNVHGKLRTSSDAVLGGRLDVGGGASFKEAVDLNGFSLSNLSAPVNSNDAATKKFVEDYVSQRLPK